MGGKKQRSKCINQDLTKLKELKCTSNKQTYSGWLGASSGSIVIMYISLFGSFAGSSRMSPFIATLRHARTREREREREKLIYNNM